MRAILKKIKLLQVGLLGLGLLLSLPGLAQQAMFRAGEHYQVLPVPVAVADPERLEVVEVFSYFCPTCFRMEGHLGPWKARLPEDVAFVQLPGVFDRDSMHLARAFYTAQLLGVLDLVHLPIFEALHVHNRNLMSREAIAGLVQSRAGINAQEFLEVFDSSGVTTRVRNTDAQVRAYRVRGVPSLIVQGKYLVEVDAAGGLTQQLAVVDYLLAMERALRAAQ